MKRGKRERSVPFSSLALEAEGDQPAVEPERFRGRADAFPGHWRAYPGDWGALPEERLMVARRSPPRDRRSPSFRSPSGRHHAARTLGCGSEEACATLEISEGNQRVLLTARARVRDALERHLDE